MSFHVVAFERLMRGAAVRARIGLRNKINGSFSMKKKKKGNPNFHASRESLIRDTKTLAVRRAVSNSKDSAEPDAEVRIFRF